MNFGRGRYVGLLMSDTEFGKDHNRVVGGDVAFKRGEHFQGNASFLVLQLALAGRHIEPAAMAPRRLRLQHSPLYDCRPGRALRSRFSHGHRLHQPCGVDARMAVSGAEFLSVTSTVPVDQANQPVLLGVRRGRPHSGRAPRSSYLPAVRFNFTRSGYLRVDYGTGHETFAGRKFEIGPHDDRWRRADDAMAEHRRRHAGGPGDLLRCGSAVPRRLGDRQTCGLACSRTRRFNSNTSYSFVTFKNRATGAQRVPRARPEPSKHVSVHAAILHAGRRAVRLVAQARAWRLSGLLRAVAGNGPARGLWVALRQRDREVCSSIATPRQRARSSSRRPTWRASDRRHEPARIRAIAPV